jgi:oxalate decarboxylase/phosphoglucose isomerase-like protein (cupin superfamily)
MSEAVEGTLFMPVTSMFYGSIIRLYFLDNQHRHLPHIHAKYAEFEASIGIDGGEILSGELPRKQLQGSDSAARWASCSAQSLGLASRT